MGKLLKLFIVILVGIALLSVLGFLINVLVGLAAVALKIIFISQLFSLFINVSSI